MSFQVDGYEFEIQFKEGVENKVVDALSRVDGAEMLPLIFSNTKTYLLGKTQATWETDPLPKGPRF